jgi:bifunctional DNase/RNase
MLATTDTGFIDMRITKVVGFGPPLAEDYFWCVVLDGLSGGGPLVIEIGEMESLSLGAALQGWEFGRPMTYQLTAALIRSLGGHLRQVRIDRLVEGSYAATVGVEGPLGPQSVDARASDALNLAAITSAPVLVSPDVAADGDRRRAEDSATGRLLTLAVTTPPARLMREKPQTP